MRGSIIASGVAVASGRGEQAKSGLAKAIEEAMATTIAVAYEEGLAGDPDEIKRRIEETRAKVREQFAAKATNAPSK